MDFLSKVAEHIKDRQFFSPDDKLLLAVSGGMDSMCMLYILHQLGYFVEVAHVNYHLRGVDSDEDAKLVAQSCQDLDIPFHLLNHHFDPSQYTGQKSIQAKARTIRYDFFYACLQRGHLDKICTAHNLDDQRETQILRLVEGSGIRGLRGIPQVNHMIVRPLLYFSREQIEAYIRHKKIPYRNDSSNEKSDYKRNFIRHAITPQLKKLQASWQQAAAWQHRILSSSLEWYQESIRLFWLQQMQEQHGIIYINLDTWTNQTGRECLLFELLMHFNFSPPTILAIQQAIEAGKKSVGYQSASHRLLYYKQQLIITEAEPPSWHAKALDEVQQKKEVLRLPTGTISWHNPMSATYTDAFYAADLPKPLVWRTWKEGDYMHPQGLHGKKKKISDIFTDLKIDRFLRERLVMLCHERRVLWIPGVKKDHICAEGQKPNYLYYHEYPTNKEVNVFQYDHF